MAMDADLVEQASRFGFAATVEKLERAIEGAGLTIFARVDHAGAARDAGLEMPPTLVLIYGNARGGTPIMLAKPAAALDLPLRVVVREGTDGGTVIAFHPIARLLAAAGVAEELARRLEPAQRLLLDALA